MRGTSGLQETMSYQRQGLTSGDVHVLKVQLLIWPTFELFRHLDTPDLLHFAQVNTQIEIESFRKRDT